jgi:hypothetical protein
MGVPNYVNALGMVACFVAITQPALSGESQPSPAEKAVEAKPPGSAPGVRVYIDPQTGGFLSEPPQVLRYPSLPLQSEMR